MESEKIVKQKRNTNNIEFFSLSVFEKMVENLIKHVVGVTNKWERS